jgi:hypothetical protein
MPLFGVDQAEDVALYMLLYVFVTVPFLAVYISMSFQREIEARNGT